MKFKIKTKQVVEVQEWDKLVQETYKRPYSLQQQDGCMGRGTVNVTVPEVDEEDYYKGVDFVPEIVNGEKMGVSFKAWLTRDPKQELSGSKNGDEWALRLWWFRNFYPDIQMVANDLYEKKLLDAGEYTILIDW
jgi:hypothetical protein